MSGIRRRQASFSESPGIVTSVLFILWCLVRPRNRRDIIEMVAILTFEAVGIVWFLTHVYKG
jgi:hypothetical protein